MRMVHVLRKPLSEGTVAANVLKHGCGGLKRVRGSSEGQTGGHSWGLVNDDGWDPKGVPDQRSWMEDGKESVANWICVEGCPVRALDGQSGERPSTLAGRAPAHVVADNPGSCKRSGFTGGPEGKGVGGGAGKVYADTGGASRFFKQVGGKTDE